MWRKLKDKRLYSSWTNVRACVCCFAGWGWGWNKKPLLYIKSLYQAKDHKCIQEVLLARDASDSLSCLGTKSLTSYKTTNLCLEFWKGSKEGTSGAFILAVDITETWLLLTSAQNYTDTSLGCQWSWSRWSFYIYIHMKSEVSQFPSMVSLLNLVS